MLQGGGCLLDHIAFCTHGTSSAQCVIFPLLNALNAELCEINVVLQETAPERLMLTTNVKSGLPRIHTSNRNLTAGHLLEYVVRHHRCIVSVDVDVDDFQDNLPSSLLNVILRKVPSLESLSVCNTFETEEQLRFFSCALSEAYMLKDLHLKSTVTLDARCVCFFRTLLCSTGRLTTLSMNNVHIHPHGASSLFEGLLQNSTIHTLAISTCTCFHGPEHGSPLVALLACKLTLRSLNLERCCFECRDGVVAIMKAVADNYCLSELSLVGFCFGLAFQGLMPMLLTHNDALRSLRIERSQYSYKEPCKCKADLPDCTDRPLRYLTDECPDLDLLTEGISQNKRLTELTIDLSSSPLPECQRFFMALRENKVLQRVTVTRMRSADAFEVCQLIRQNGVQERVHLAWPITVTAPVQAAVRGLYLSSACIDCTDSQNRILQHGGLNWLPVWKHTRDLSLRLHCDQLVSGYAHLLSYLNVTTDLRNLCLNIEGRIADKRLRQNLMMTLLGNPGVRKLKIVGGLVVDRDEVRDFAKALCFNDSLFDFSLFRDTTQESSDVVPD
ncbi:hypothetical protein HPB50_023767 [Hyalomma asiaticum]|uniref:Uncharacterized protein n=1 Tax=Hyalomma asiaticum TaxID=266040 RepID=A0ACB7RSE0_HYAAI|nr:hypothetical protein HPB50_023767 [Hyalomma asiaticum]